MSAFPQGDLSARRTLPEEFNTGIDVDHCIMVADAGHGFHPIYQCGSIAYEDVQSV